MSNSLASFEWLLKATDHVIRCPQVFLDEWHDGKPPLFEGSGRLTLTNNSSIRFEIDAKPSSQKEAFDALRRCVEDPYAPNSAMRFRGIDYSGTEWNGGWVHPALGEVQGNHWQLFGECGGLSASIQHVEPRAGVELAYSPAPEVPFSESMRTTAHLGDTKIGWRTSGGRHRMEVLGSEIEVVTQPWTKELWIRASTSDDLNHPYLENWLSEPLRALRGQLIYPRLVARNYKDGTGFVSVRPAPALKASMGGCASQLRDRSAGEFWSFYSNYLAYVARYRNADSNPEFEANGLTRLHDEVIQARMAGSHWVIALCVASAIEGIVKLDPEFKSTPSDFTTDELASIEKLVWTVNPEALRSRLQGTVSQLKSASVSRYLSLLQQQGLISSAQLSAWKKVRNVVAHGNLFESWETSNEREQLVHLVELFYRLSSVRIGYVV